MNRSVASRGFTMLELMIASAILLVVTVHVLATFSSQMRTYTTQKRISDVQEDARLAAEIVVRDVRLAGFMVPSRVGISSRDGGVAAPDAVCVSDAGVISDASLDTAVSNFGGASLAAALGATTTSVTLVVGDLDIDNDTNDDFTIGDGIIVSDGAMSHCARISNIAAGVISFLPATPAGFTVPMGPGRAVPAVIYEIRGGGLQRNSQLISSMVEDLQIEFAVDNDGDGMIGPGEFPIHNLTGSDISAIGGAQLSVLTRSDRQDPDVAGPGRQRVANHDPGAADNFRRRLVSIVTAPRNLQ